MGEAMYQGAFLSFENCLNSVVVGSEAEHKFKNIEVKISFKFNTVKTFHLTPLITKGNKTF